MRFDPSKWVALQPGEIPYPDGGIVHVRCVTPMAVMVRNNHGDEAMLGYGHDVRGTIYSDSVVVVSAASGAVIYVYDVNRELIQPQGPSFTNVDRRPSEYGAYAKLARQFEIAERRRDAEVRRLKHQLNRSAAHSAATRPAAPPPPEPEIVEGNGRDEFESE